MTSFEHARQLVVRAVTDRVAPAACVETGDADGPVWREAFGTLSHDAAAEPARLDTCFDLASLSKVIVTTTVALRLVAEGRLRLDACVAESVPDWTGADRAGVTVRDLLEHCSGLPAHEPLFERHESPDGIRRAVATCALAYAPRTTSVYSDLGFMLLGWVLERAGGASLESLWLPWWRRVSADAPADEAAFDFRPRRDLRRRVAPTRRDEWRGRLLVGEVDDNNAWALGGVAGHAGLFGTAGAVGRFARLWLAGLQAGGGAADAPVIAPRRVLQDCLLPSDVPGSSRACGWDLMRPTSSCGTRMSPHAFGHTGFTGTSLWIDPARGTYAVLLTNRVHPTAGSSDGIQALRRAFHDALWSIRGQTPNAR